LLVYIFVVRRRGTKDEFPFSFRASVSRGGNKRTWRRRGTKCNFDRKGKYLISHVEQELNSGVAGHTKRMMRGTASVTSDAGIIIIIIISISKDLIGRGEMPMSFYRPPLTPPSYTVVGVMFFCVCVFFREAHHLPTMPHDASFIAST
jgi:hypothetical protein